jgi:hypothetical protein
MKTKTTFLITLFSVIFANCSVVDSIVNQTKHNEQFAIIQITSLTVGQYSALQNGKKCEEDISKIERSVYIDSINDGYNFEIKCDEKFFQIWANPKSYGREGRKSFYLDSNNGIIFGDDHKGEKATANDSVVRKAPYEWKEFLNKQK